MGLVILVVMTLCNGKEVSEDYALYKVKKTHLPEHKQENEIDYISDLELPEEKRPIGKYGRLRRDYYRVEEIF